MPIIVSKSLKPKGRFWLHISVVLLVGLFAFAAMIYYVVHSLGSGGTLRVESEPDGASVFLNGHVAGATPLAIKGLATGTYDIRLEKFEYTPRSFRVDVDTSKANRIHEKLTAVSKGVLVVNIKPDDAEVLIDGEIAGHTPLKLDNVEAGPHELLVRKTNFSSFARRVEIVAGEECKYDGNELTDKMLELLENQVRSEPQRVSHYVDLAHYYFVNNRIDDSVDMFIRGQEVISTPLDFDGPGFPGKAKMSPEEIELEQRLRREDASRYPKELDKHRNFPRRDSRVFRAKLAEALDGNTRKDVKSWPRTKSAALEKIAIRHYEEAAQLYKEHIAATPASPELPKAYLGLIEVLCMVPDVDGVTDQFNKFFALYQKKDAAALRECGKIVNQYFERPKKADRPRLLKIAEQALRASLELPCDADAKSQALYDLGMCLYYQERVADSVPVLRQSVELTRSPMLKEDRQLRLAESLRKSGDKAAASDLYAKLKDSERPNVRETANYGIIAIRQTETRN